MKDIVIQISEPFEDPEVDIGLRLRQRVQTNDESDEYLDRSAVYLETYLPNGDTDKDILIGANEIPRLVEALQQLSKRRSQQNG